jgi:hypothetical protein
MLFRRQRQKDYVQLRQWTARERPVEFLSIAIGLPLSFAVFGFVIWYALSALRHF